MIDLTVVIPISLGFGREYLLERVVELALFFLKKNVAVIVSEQNSESGLLAQMIREMPVGAKVVSSAGRADFSLAQVRNKALKEVTTEWVLLSDADLIFRGDIVERLTEVIGQSFMESDTAFLTFPVVYLAANADPIRVSEVSLSRARCVGDDNVEFVALGSSVVLVRRAHIESVGMYCEDFHGWGFEDHDLAMRLVAADDTFLPVREPRLFDPRPMQELFQYIGWRSVYRLYGDLAAANELFAWHLWHPVMSSFRSAENVERNEGIFRVRSRDVKFRDNYVPAIGVNSCLYDPYRMSLDINRYGYLLSLLRARLLASKKIVNFYRKLRKFHAN